MDFTFLGGPALHQKILLATLHKVAHYIRFYESGPVVKLGTLAAIFLWILLGWKFYRAHYFSSRSNGGVSEANYSKQVEDLYFTAVMIFASLVGLMLGNALYFIVRGRLT